MAKVPLRIYLREIEDAIEEGQTDEAVQHCRHVLKVFPKHIDTYRLLGKAFLEAQRYGSAADIFQRVLSAIPDDFVSHVGMSIIREDEENIDTSLWHMERAFEVQPYNPAIQGEVRRLYGKRDGMEPSKARLTRGALARTYAKGDHYEQAIAELRAALADEPDRSDLQVLLAEMYAKVGENVKAIETCSLVLKNLPFCLPANRLLGNLLQGTEREDESKAYLQRVHALDPYEAHISSHAPTADDVPEQAVTIDRMDWGVSVTPSAPDQQPEWASSLGVEIDEPDSREAGIPDWLSAASEDSPVSEEPADLTPASEEEIPEWMKDAGWEPSSGEVEEGPSPLTFDDQPEGVPDSAIEADLPDWVKDMAPATASAAAAQPDGDSFDMGSLFDEDDKEPVASDTPDWMKSIEGDEDSLEPSLPGQEQEIPDWMTTEEKEAPDPQREVEEPSPQAEEALPDWLDAGDEEPTPVAAAPQAADDIPDWLKGVDEVTPGEESQDAESTGVTDFLVGLGMEKAEEDEPPQPQPEAPAEADADDIPDWLKSPEPDAAAETQPEPVVSGEPETEAVAEGDLDWLKDLDGAYAEEPTDEVASEPAPAAEPPAADDIPDWLKSAEPDVAAEPQAEQPLSTESQPEDDTADDLDWLKDVEAEKAEEPADEIEVEAPVDAASPEGDIPDWLQSLEGEEEAAPAEATQPEPDEVPEELAPEPDTISEADDIPDWLKTVESETKDVMPAAAEKVEAEEVEAEETIFPADIYEEVELPSEARAEAEAEAAVEIEDPAEADVSAEAEVPAEAGGVADIPDWLKSLDETEEAAAPEAATPEPIETPTEAEAQAADVPDWLDDLAEASLADEGEAEPQPQAVEAPDWLAEISEGEPLDEKDTSVTPDMMRTAAAAALEKEESEERTLPSFDDLDAAVEPEQEFPEWISSPGAADAQAEIATEPTSLEEPIDVPAEAETPAETDEAFPEWLAPPSDEKPADTAGEPAAEFEDADAAMAWLDDLASQPDVLDEELLSQPEEQPVSAPEAEPADVEPAEAEPTMEAAVADDTPDWLKELDQDEAITDEQPSPVDATPEEATPEVVAPADEVAAEPTEVPDFEDPDAAMAWLEGLAAKKGVSEDELITSPDERPDAPPDWVHDTAADDAEDAVPTEEPAKLDILDDAEPVEAEPEAVTGEVTPEDIPEWLQDGAFAPAATDEQEEPVAEETVPTDPVDVEPKPEPVAEDIDAQGLEGAEELVEADPADTEDLIEAEPSEKPDDTPEWLKDALSDAPTIIAADQGEDVVSEAPVSEPTVEPIEDSEGLPDWLKDVSPDVEDAAEAEDATWIREFGKEVPSFETADTVETPAEPEAQAEPEPIDDIFADAEAVVEDAEVSEAVADEEPLPDWLQEFDDETTQPETAQPEPAEAVDQPKEDEYTWRPSEAQPPAEAEPVVAEPVDAEPVTTAPQEMLDLNQASLIELERLPGMGFRRAQAVFSHREEHGAFDKLDDLLVLGIDADTIDGLKELVEVKPVAKGEEPVSPTAPTEALPAEPEAETPTPVAIPTVAPEDAEDEHHAIQIGAQERLAKGDISGAMQEYDQLIKKGKRIDEIITDLEAADQAKPDDPEILQILGDAYMRADRLQEALDTYSKVEQLLQ